MILLIRPNARRGMYFTNQSSPHSKYGYTPVASVSCNSKLYFYEKKTLGKYKQGLNVGPLIEMGCCIVHELTHHTQFKKNGLSKKGNFLGGELETTANELEFLKLYFPEWYDLIMIEEPVKKMKRTKF